MALRANALNELPEGTKTAFAWTPRPPAVALDLAIQAAGLISIPVTDSRQAVFRGATVWADPGGASSWLGADIAVEEGRGGGASGGVAVIGEEGRKMLSPQELVTAADRIQDAIAPGRGREIAVLGGSPEQWPNRALLAWATLHGAALVLAPTPDSLVSSAVWARPSVFLGTAAELAALRRAVEREGRPFWDRRRGRLPFGRLRTVLWSEDEEVSPEEVDFWTARGVLVFRCPPVSSSS